MSDIEILTLLNEVLRDDDLYIFPYNDKFMVMIKAGSLRDSYYYELIDTCDSPGLAFRNAWNYAKLVKQS